MTILLVITTDASVLSPTPSISFVDFLFRHKLSVLYMDLLHPVDFPVFIQLDYSFDIGVLLFGLIVRIFRVQVAAELLYPLLDIERGRKQDPRRELELAHRSGGLQSHGAVGESSLEWWKSEWLHYERGDK